jgi:hypothetical protein
MIHKIGFLLALAASVLSLATDFDKKKNKTIQVHTISVITSLR